MTPICPAGQVNGKRTAYETAMYLRRIEREHAAAMYGWNHPENIEWAARRAAARATAYAGIQCFSMEAQR
jgi:hypothetical protein